MNKKIFAANWKLHKSPKEARAFFTEWSEKAKALKGQAVFFPTSICLEATSQSLRGSDTQFGAQNAYFEDKGAFTGETSPMVLKELGAQWALVGHSERRSIFGEMDAMLAKKVRKLQDQGLTPMLCIGELLPEREANQTMTVLRRQLVEDLSLADKTKPVAIAYEPVWAIGTGQVARAEQVQEAHAFIHQELLKLGWPAMTPILYGGSVKADNAASLIALPYVDGFLVGGASLEVDSFLAIARA